MADGRSVLVNFVYCHPVGHTIEALHYCHGYHRADPGLRIGLALNADSPVELATLCPYIGDVYPVTLDVPSMCRARITADLAQITEGAARLIERRWPAEEAMAGHVARMLALRGHTDQIWSVDDVHRKYLNWQN